MDKDGKDRRVTEHSVHVRCKTARDGEVLGEEEFDMILRTVVCSNCGNKMSKVANGMIRCGKCGFAEFDHRGLSKGFHG